jgi:hypothetical protein
MYVLLCGDGKGKGKLKWKFKKKQFKRGTLVPFANYIPC